MTIKLNGYLRDNPGGAALSGKTISLLDVNTDLAPTTNTHTNLSSTTDVTDANGYWEFTMDLGTGPLYVKADLGGGDFGYRRNHEMFIYQAFPIDNLPNAFRAINDGVVGPYPGSSNIGFAVTPSATRVLSVAIGEALIRGYPIGWNSGPKTLTGNANGASGTTRHDFVVLRQWHGGSSVGKQDLVLVAGGASADPVATTSEVDLTQFIRGDNIWDLPVARAKLAFGSTLYTVDDLRGVWPYPLAGQGVYGEIGGTATLDTLTADTSFVAKGGQATARLTVNSNNVDVDGPLLIGSYVKSDTTSPSITIHTSDAGAGATGSISGTDRQGQITVNPGPTGRSEGVWVTVTMDTTMPNTSYNIWLQGIEETAIDDAGKFRAIASSTTQWVIEALNSTPSNDQHIWKYMVEAY
jgi:hypothetical protein